MRKSSARGRSSAASRASRSGFPSTVTSTRSSVSALTRLRQRCLPECRRMRKATWGIVAVLLLCLPPAARAQGLTGYVNPLIGTAGSGLVAPGASVPFGMVQNSPDTVGAIGGGGYQADSQAIQGFSLLHLAGAGVKSEGDLPFMPVIGPVGADDPLRFASSWDQASEHAEPGYYRVRLDQPGIDVELTATTRTAVQRYRFPPAPAADVIV